MIQLFVDTKADDENSYSLFLQLSVNKNVIFDQNDCVVYH